MARKLPPLNAVRAFEAAARHVSFTKAASELHVTHGAISRQVAILEDWLGANLFRRSASQLTLTEAGQRFASEVTAILDRLEICSAHHARKTSQIALDVSAPPTFAMRWLIARMSSFQRQMPDVEIRLTTSVSPVNFQEHSHGVVIRGAHAPTPDCNSVPFLTEHIVPICHIDLLEQGRLAQPEDLRRHTLISYATEPYSWADWMASAGVPDLQGGGALHFEQMFFGLQAASEGLGIVLVPLFLVVDDIVSGRLCAPFGLLAARRRRYYANTTHAMARDSIAHAFLEWLLREGRDSEESIASWARGMGWVIPEKGGEPAT